MTSISKVPLKFFWANTSRITRNIVMRGSMLKLKTWHRGLLLMLSIRQHLKFIRILSHPQTKQLIVSKPELTYKYLRNYISFNIPARTGLLILISHYSYLQNNFKIDFLENISHLPILLWGQYIEGMSFEIVMAFPHTVDHEGDLCLIFRSDMVNIYRVIFVIADGSLFELPDDHVMCISSVQGINGFEGIQQATKNCHDVQPAQLLMAAMSGLGQALGITTIVGIATKNQISQSEKFYFSYDQFFGKYGDLVPQKSFYKIQLPYVESPLDLIHTRHRKRTQKKRTFKNEVRDKAACSIEQYLVKEPTHFSVSNA